MEDSDVQEIDPIAPRARPSASPEALHDRAGAAGSVFRTRFTALPLPDDERPPPGTSRYLCRTSEQIRRRSIQCFPGRSPMEMVGLDPTWIELLRRVRKIAPFDEPVLVQGESGVGKELVARALYLLSDRTQHPFVAVNCPQHQDGNLTVSELFGHERGSFTGATNERKGSFEAADGGVVFLDEVADLPMTAQVMLLRALAEGEFKRLGSNQARRVNVRVVAATNKRLEAMHIGEAFREDLYFRLRYFSIEVPPLRRRGNDWYLLLQHRLDALTQRHGVEKYFSVDALRLLERYPWPGNIRELNNVVATGYAMADGLEIRPADFESMLGRGAQAACEGVVDELYRQLRAGSGDFWRLVHAPFMRRDLNRREVRTLIKRGLATSGGSYRELLPLFGLGYDDYQKFMDFLRNHELKPMS